MYIIINIITVPVDFECQRKKKEDKYRPDWAWAFGHFKRKFPIPITQAVFWLVNFPIDIYIYIATTEAQE